MKKITIMYLILLTGCSINTSALSETSLSGNIIATTSNTTSEIITDFAYITGIELDDVKYAGYSLSGQSNRNLKDNKDDIEKIYNSINKDNIKNVDDFYLIDDFNLNFMTLYVYENNNGIIQYYFNVNEYDESKDAIYNLIELFYNDENNKGILSSTGLLSSESLQYGDKIICHYNCRKSKVYTIPPQLEVYNLFYTGENVEFI